MLFDGRVDDFVGVAQNDSADGAHPVDVLIFVNIDEAGAFGSLGVDRAGAVRELVGAAADQLCPAGYQLACLLVEVERAGNVVLRRLGERGHM